VATGSGLRLGSRARGFVGLEQLADLALTVAGDSEELAGEFNRLRFGVRLKDGKAADDLLRLGEWTVTVIVPFERRTRAPKALGRQPSTASG
jgi:hypothetical protein